MNATEIFNEAMRLLKDERLLDVGLFITRGKHSDILWWSKGTLKKELKKKLRSGVAEAFLKIHANGDGRWRADAEPLPGIDPKRAQILVWNFGRKHWKWSNGLH